MTKLTSYCRCATAFTRSGDIDEDAMRRLLHRLAETGHAVYLASGGAGEGHTMTLKQLSQVYRLGVEVCKGRVQVCANMPEQHTARATKEHAAVAMEAGVDIINVYQPAGWHGYIARDSEHLAFFDDVLSFIRYPIALAPLPPIGTYPNAAMVADLCHRYPQIETVNLVHISDQYFIALKSMIGRKMTFNVTLDVSLKSFALGASGIVGAEANIVPELTVRYLDLCERNDVAAMTAAYADLVKVNAYLAPWNNTNSRWIKMYHKAFGMPGGEGGPHEPTRLPDDREIAAFVEGLLRLGIPEIEQQAIAAGLSLRR